MTCPICEQSKKVTRMENSLILDFILLGESADNFKRSNKFYGKYNLLKTYLLDLSESYNENIDYINLRGYKNHKTLYEYAENQANNIKSFILNVGSNPKVKKKLYENSMEHTMNVDNYVKEWYFKNGVDVLLLEMPLIEMFSEKNVTQIKDSKNLKIFSRMTTITEMMLNHVLYNLPKNKSVFIKEVTLNNMGTILNEFFQPGMKGTSDEIKASVAQTAPQEPVIQDVEAQTSYLNNPWVRGGLIASGIGASVYLIKKLLNRASASANTGDYDSAIAECNKIPDKNLRKSCLSKIKRIEETRDVTSDEESLYNTISAPQDGGQQPS